MRSLNLAYHDDSDEDGEDDDGREDGAEDVEVAEHEVALVVISFALRSDLNFAPLLRRVRVRPLLLAPLERPHHDCEVREVVALAHRGRRVGGGHAAASVRPSPEREGKLELGQGMLWLWIGLFQSSLHFVS